MSICKKITCIIRSKKQDIEPFFKITEKKWNDTLNKIDDDLIEKWFRWDKIPGRDSEKLIKFLKDEFGIDWLNSGQINRVDDKNRRASSGNNSILLNLSSDEGKVTLYIDNSIKDEFIVKKEKNKLKVYHEFIKNIPEEYLTFIIACAYAIDGKNGCNSFLKKVCGDKLPENFEESTRIWFEAMPLKGISSPTLDLAFGNFNRPNNDNTKTQIEYINGHVCFVEMKTWKDIQSSSTDNPKYNQLAKYIRSALIFQQAGVFPREVHVTLVTPRIFHKNWKSRLYGYKFREYACPQINADNIINDIELPIINEKIENNWINYDKNGMVERLPFLKLHWIAYEDILDAVPDGDLKKYINQIRAANPIFDKPLETK